MAADKNEEMCSTLTKILNIDMGKYKAYQIYTKEIANDEYVPFDVFDDAYEGYFKSPGAFVAAHHKKHDKSFKRLCPILAAHIDWDAVWYSVYVRQYMYKDGHVFHLHRVRGNTF